MKLLPLIVLLATACAGWTTSYVGQETGTATITAPPAPPTPHLRVNIESGPAEYWWQCDTYGPRVKGLPGGNYCKDPATCYTGINGYVGCCSTTSCAARTTCYDGDKHYSTSNPCEDENNDGCTVCGLATNSAEQATGDGWCQTFSNVANNQFVYGCSGGPESKQKSVTTFSLFNGVESSSPPAQLPRKVSATSTSTMLYPPNFPTNWYSDYPTGYPKSDWSAYAAHFTNQVSNPAETASAALYASDLAEDGPSFSALPTESSWFPNGTNSTSSSSSSTGEKVGLGIGIPLAVAALAFLIWFFKCWRWSCSDGHEQEYQLPRSMQDQYEAERDQARTAPPLPRNASIRSVHATSQFLSPLEQQFAERQDRERQAALETLRQPISGPSSQEIYEMADTSQGWYPPATSANPNPSGRWTPTRGRAYTAGNTAGNVAQAPNDRLSHVTERTERGQSLTSPPDSPSARSTTAPRSSQPGVVPANVRPANHHASSSDPHAKVRPAYHHASSSEQSVHGLRGNGVLQNYGLSAAQNQPLLQSSNRPGLPPSQSEPQMGGYEDRQTAALRRQAERRARRPQSYQQVPTSLVNQDPTFRFSQLKKVLGEEGKRR